MIIKTYNLFVFNVVKSLLKDDICFKKKFTGHVAHNEIGFETKMRSLS